LKLTCEALPAVEDATEADIETVVGGGLFGGYAMLHGEGERFLQVGFKGRPAPWAFDYEPGTWERDFAEGCKAFTERTGSERWALDYFDATTRENYEVDGDRTLSEVTQAFIEYLRGNDAWRTRYTWTLARLNRGRLPEIPR
jgi:hypothetical protein